MHQFVILDTSPVLAWVLPMSVAEVGLMRSIALYRYSLAAFGAAALSVAVTQFANLHTHLPVHQLKLAWTLARVLIQL
jgi:hypothetical protein